MALGSARTGVDLSQEGGQRSDDWHIEYQASHELADALKEDARAALAKAEAIMGKKFADNGIFHGSIIACTRRVIRGNIKEG